MINFIGTDSKSLIGLRYCNIFISKMSLQRRGSSNDLQQMAVCVVLSALVVAEQRNSIVPYQFSVIRYHKQYTGSIIFVHFAGILFVGSFWRKIVILVYNITTEYIMFSELPKNRINYYLLIKPWTAKFPSILTKKYM